MPKQVDSEQRRRDIVEATMQVLARSGTRGLSFRAVAKQMGGSTSLITHYFPTNSDLLDALAAHLVTGWDEEIKGFDVDTDDPRERLVNVLRWLSPITETGLFQEIIRVQLLAGQLLGDEHREKFEDWDERMRTYLRVHVEALVAPAKVKQTVELLRVATSGLSLLVVEHPTQWSEERQMAVIEGMLSLLDLG